MGPQDGVSEGYWPYVPALAWALLRALVVD